MNVSQTLTAMLKRKRRTLFWLWGIASGLGVGLLIHFEGYDAPLIAAMIGAFLMPIALIGCVLATALWLWKKWAWFRFIALNAEMLCLFLVIQVVGTLAFAGFASDSPSKLKENCEHIQQSLEAYRNEKGQYPPTLAALKTSQTLPVKFKPSLCNYNGNSDSYSFGVSGGFLSYWTYDSTLNEWSIH